MKCLNIKNKEVKAALDEVAAVLGSEDAAYYIISENEGYAIDQAPNGEPSKLFSDLLSYYNGDREAAIKAKAKTFTPSFKEWFGESKAIDLNGEPQIVYHHSDKQISEFETGFPNYFTTVKGGTDKAIFFTETSHPKEGTVLDRSYSYPVYLSVKDSVTLTGTKDQLRESGSDFTSSINKASLENDGIVFKGIDDNQELNQTIHVIFNPNLVKSIDNTGMFSTIDNRILYNIEEEISTTSNFDEIFSQLMQVETGLYDSREVVSYIKNNINVSESMSKLLDLLGKMPVKIKIMQNLDGYMEYDPSDDSIHINPVAFNRNTIQYNVASIAHELVHWYVSQAYHEKSTPQQQKLASLIDNTYFKYKGALLDVPSTGTFYGLKDQDEFIAELLTNQDFYSELIDIAISYDRTGKLLDYIKQLLNSISQYLTKQFGIDLGLFSNKEIEQIQNTKDALLEFISSYNDEMINDVNDFRQLRTLQNAFFQRSLNNDTQRIKNKLQAFDAYDFNTAEELDKRLASIRTKLTEKLESRYSAIDIEDKAEKVRVKQAIKYQLTNLRDNAISTVSNTINILQDLKLDLQPIAHKVIGAYTGSGKVLSNEELISLDRNFFGFYCPVLEDIRTNLSDLSEYREIMGKDDYDKILADIQLCKTLLDNCASYVKKMQVKNATDLLQNIGVKANSPTIYNYIAENTEETGFEISTLTRLLGAGDKINDEAIKSLYKIIQDAEDKVNHATFNKATKLLKLLKNAGNKQYKLFEVDDNGKPTGYIIRDKNYGKFHNNYKAELERIKKQLGLNPGELGLPENKDLRKQYNKLRNKWLSENCERKYTDEYYAMFEELSQEATDARELIQLKIRNLTDKVRNKDGVPEFERLSPEDWDQLNRFYIEKKQLASKYDVYGDLKQGIDAEIAKELSDLNEKLAKGMKLRTNEAKFEQVRASKEASLSAKEYKEWLDRNTRVQYTEEFYEQLKNVERTMYGEEYAVKNDEKRAILNMFRDDKTGEVQKSLMPNVTINKINKLDRELRQIRKKNKKAPKEGSILFEDIAKIVPTEAFNKAYRQAVEDSQEDPMALEVFLLQHANQDAKGKAYPKSYYSKIVPKDEKYIKRVPSSGFSELSPESAFYNKKYDHTNQEEYYQPKSTAGYDNKAAFKKLTPELLELRKELINVMEESNRNLTNITRSDKYKMPQISGSMLRFMKSNMGYMKGALEYTKDAISTRGDDEGIHDKPKYAPDGTSLNFVPQYFVKDLEDPSTIAADLVGSVLRYYKMSENFKQKTAIRGDVEIIKKFLAQRKYSGTQKGKLGRIADLFKSKKNAKEGTDTNIYKFAEQFIAMNLYNVQTNALTISIGEHNFNLFGKEINVKAREINMTKILSGIKTLGTLRNLGLSMWIAGTGFFTASHNHIVQMLIGRYYTLGDAISATKSLVWDLFKYGWRTVGNQNYKSKQMALMDYFETGGSIESIYKDSNELSSLRTLSKHWAFGLYSLSDFLVKGTILNSVMYNYRKVNDEFICKEDYLNKYGNTESTRDAWKKYKSAYDSVEYVNGQIQVKDIKDAKSWEKAKFIIGRTAQNLGASADGTLSALQKAQFTSNVFGAMVMMHRQYLPLAIQEKWTMDMQWDYTSQRYREGILKTPLRVFKLAKKDERNISFIKKFIEHSKSDIATKSNMKQLLIEGVLVLSIYPILRTMLNDAADDDRKDFWLNLFAYIMMRTSFEAGAPYNLIDIARTVKNPTPLFSMLDNWGSLMSYPLEQIYNLATDKKGKNKTITRGAYKGMKPVEKALIQSTPIKNLIEIQDLPSKRNYYDKQILGN